MGGAGGSVSRKTQIWTLLGPEIVSTSNHEEFQRPSGGSYMPQMRIARECHPTSFPVCADNAQDTEIVWSEEVTSIIDETLAYVSLENAGILTGLENKIHGFRLKYNNLFEAPYLVWQSLILAEKDTNILMNAEDWSYTYGPLFEAIMMEKSLVFLLLSLIIVVAAFNIVSMLMTMINEKREQIAILQTMGMTSKEIFKVFLFLGILIAFIGTILGLIFGLGLTFIIGSSIFESQLS